MTEDHIEEQHVTDHVKKEYNLQYYMTIENHIKDHIEE